MNRGVTSSSWKTTLRLALLAVALLVIPRPAYSQGCALCYTQAASSGRRMIDALKSGILILVVPPTFMTVAMIGVCYRKRDDFQDPDVTSEFDRSW